MMLNGRRTSAEAPEEQPAQLADLDRSSSAVHAVVIGGSIAGLTAAQMLAGSFERVTIIERDHLPQSAEFRAGAPQARHAHLLLPRGQAILEQQFPGLTEALVQRGAVAMHPSRDVLVFEDGDWYHPPSPSDQLSLACSRPLLEHAVRAHLKRNPRVEILQGTEVLSLKVDAPTRRVQGVTVRRRGAAGSVEELPASLVLDASGRASRAPQWLRQLDFCPPQEWTINAFVGYTTRLYRRPTDFEEEWKALHVRLSPPDHTRGGLIVPLEGDRWQVALVGIARDHPPTDEEGFMAFAHSLSTPVLHDAIAAAEPLTPPFGYRHTANRLRRYDRLPCYLEGFLVCGDAACTLNPVYALGMTAAVAGGPVLQNVLEQYAGSETIDGLAATFQRELGRALMPYWRLATRNDWDWPITEVEDNELFLEELE